MGWGEWGGRVQFISSTIIEYYSYTTATKATVEMETAIYTGKILKAEISVLISPGTEIPLLISTGNK